MIRANSLMLSFCRPRSSGQSQRRRGVSILEVVIACILVSALVSVSAQLLRLVNRTQADTQRRETAVQEANSVLERITLAPWVNLTSEKLASETKPVSSLPDGKLKVAVDQVPQEADAKRITVEIDWKTGQAMRASPVRLSAWVYRRGETP